MNHLQKFTAQVRNRLVALLLLNNLLFLVAWWLIEYYFKLDGWWLVGGLAVVPVLGITLIPWLSTRYFVQPTKLIWQAILHLAPDADNVPAPDLKHARLGRELVTTLVTHVYQLAHIMENINKTDGPPLGNLKSDFIANSLPLPLLILDSNDTIVFENEALRRYISADSPLVGQNVYSVLDLAFTNEHTFDAWLKQAKNSKVTATQTWERVRLKGALANKTLYFDLAAYYNKNNPDNFETMLVLFDHTSQYSQDEQAMSFVALAVHELRTPLTLLRGYIEAFDEELEGKLNPEMQSFMQKMKAAAQQLGAFVNTILNVARVEDDQLVLNLREEQWPQILRSAINDLQLRAQVRGINLELNVDDNVPAVAVDPVSIFEVLNNLVDNAIKYSADSKKIVLKSYLSRDGMVETTVQDFGVGIPESGLSSVFEKFYRNHRNRAQIGGTGLGLYLSKAIVGAHGGHIWIRSKEGQGTTVGFTLQPYAQLAAEHKSSDNNGQGITRSAHGWIKNHSLYRR